MHILFVWGWGEEFREDVEGVEDLWRGKGGGEQGEAEHNNCSCVHKRGSSNMRAIGHWKRLWGITQVRQ